VIRVTLQDPQQTISFLTAEDIAHRLLAGCSANPGTVGELLLATEIFQQGISTAVMSQLMTFDKTLQRHGPARAHQFLANPDQSHEKVRGAFQVVDAHTAALAVAAEDHPLLILDLTERTIHVSGELQVRSTGEILAHTGDELTDRSITYVLSQEWTIQALS